MCCRIVDMRNRAVVCIKDGTHLGCMCDVMMDTCTGKILSIVVPGRPRWGGILGREDDIVIDWCDIEVFGNDTILVSCDPPRACRHKKRGFFRRMFTD